jgi:acyl-CoA thioesterase I
MGTRRLGRAVAVLIALSCVATGCAASSSAPNASSPAGASGTQTWSIVALGDSVPRGTNCDCRPYPSLTADGLATSSGQRVTATNDSVAGFTTADVLHQLKSDGDVISHVHSARAVEIEIGANDAAYSTSCGTVVACYAPGVRPIRKNLTAIVGRVRNLTSGHKVLVVLLDYWSVWLGGQYAAAKGAAYVAAAKKVTDEVNDIIKSVAAKSRSAYVDLRAAFKGPNYDYDETHDLSNDGDHPNAAGQQLIASATEAVIKNVRPTMR